jgi:hypothetical protein
MTHVDTRTRVGSPSTPSRLGQAALATLLALAAPPSPFSRR